MMLDFDDACWSHDDDDWRRSLTELLVLLAIHEQHSLLATSEAMLSWCRQHLVLYVDYFKTRLASAQWRANACTIRISPQGSTDVTTPPPWTLAAKVARDLVSRPLRLVLENDHSDRMFVESTVPSFKNWCGRKWIEPAMGGGSAMMKDIATVAADAIGRWRTFYLFDSDRLHPTELLPGWTPPGGDGCQGHNFESSCSQMPSARWHRLERRSIENYLPQSLLSALNSTATSVLFSPSVGVMANFYNFKKGLTGDGVSPADPKKTVRASRCLGFWTSLPNTDIAELEKGFGDNVSNEFKNIPMHHPWPPNVLAEMSLLADALQDAM